MNHEIPQDLALDNARTFLNRQLIPALHKLIALESLDIEGRNAILELAGAICTLPDIDHGVNISLKIDLYWEDRNWIGTLDIADSAMMLRSGLCQLEGLKPELMGQWQHTALETKSISGRVIHDPSRLWFWIDCFSRFVNGFFNSSTSQHATFKLTSYSSNLDLQYGRFLADRESQ